MSGYRNSGLTEQEFEDREKLKAAAEVIDRLWPDLYQLAATVEAMSDAVVEGL